MRAYTPRRELAKPNLKIDFAFATVVVMFLIMAAMHVVAGNVITPNITDVQRTLERSNYPGMGGPKMICPLDPGFQIQYGNVDNRRQE